MGVEVLRVFSLSVPFEQQWYSQQSVQCVGLSCSVCLGQNKGRWSSLPVCVRAGCFLGQAYWTIGGTHAQSHLLHKSCVFTAALWCWLTVAGTNNLCLPPSGWMWWAGWPERSVVVFVHCALCCGLGGFSVCHVLLRLTEKGTQSICVEVLETHTRPPCEGREEIGTCGNTHWHYVLSVSACWECWDVCVKAWTLKGCGLYNQS